MAQLQTIYLYGFIISGGLTLLYILLGDVFEGIFEVFSEGYLNPILILSYFTFFSCTAYLSERFTQINSLLILMTALVLSFMLVSLLNIFVLIPLSKAEATLAFTEEELKGRVGTVIIAVPKDGFGEVLIQGDGGNIAKSAVSFENEEIPYGEQVLVIDVQNHVLHVSPQEKLDY